MNPNDEEEIELHNSLLQGAHELLDPYIVSDEAKDASSPEANRIVRRGCHMLERVIEINAENWSAMWFLGHARNALGEESLAYDAFKRAFEIERENPDVARELGRICIQLGKGEEALQATQHAMQLSPDDAGLVANYALALMINGRLESALDEVDRALMMDPVDLITQRLKDLMTDIRSHEIPPPSKWPPS